MLTIGRRGNYSRAHYAIALFGAALIGVIWAATTQRIVFERKETMANAERETSNLVMAFEEQTVTSIRCSAPRWIFPA